MGNNPAGRPRAARGRAWMGLVRRHGVVEAARRWRGARKPGYASNAWTGAPAGHRRAALKGWRRRKSGRRNVWHGARAGHRRAALKGWRRRSRRNPVYRAARGRFTARRTGRALRRISGGGWRNGPRMRPRRRASRNPANWGVSAYRNRRRSYRLSRNPIAEIAARVESVFTSEGLGTLLQGLAGMAGSLAGAQFFTTSIMPVAHTPIGRILSTFGVAVLGSLVMDRVVPGSGRRFLTGGLLATGYRALSELVPAEKKADFPIPLLAGMGAEPGEEAFRKAIESEILKELRAPAGGGVSGMGQSYWIDPAGVEQYYVQPAGMQAYMTKSEARTAAPETSPSLGAYITAMEAEKSGVQGMGMYDEFSGAFSPERF